MLLDHEARYPLERMLEIERLEKAERERLAAKAGRGGPQYLVRASVADGEAAAMETLTALLDAGYDGTLVSREAHGVVLYELRIGPFDSLEEAQRVGGVIQRSHDLAPSVLVVEPPNSP